MQNKLIGYSLPNKKLPVVNILFREKKQVNPIFSFFIPCIRPSTYSENVVQLVYHNFKKYLLQFCKKCKIMSLLMDLLHANPTVWAKCPVNRSYWEYRMRDLENTLGSLSFCNVLQMHKITRFLLFTIFCIFKFSNIVFYLTEMALPIGKKVSFV